MLYYSKTTVACTAHYKAPSPEVAEGVMYAEVVTQSEPHCPRPIILIYYFDTNAPFDLLAVWVSLKGPLPTFLTPLPGISHHPEPLYRIRSEFEFYGRSCRIRRLQTSPPCNGALINWRGILMSTWMKLSKEIKSNYSLLSKRLWKCWW